MDVVLECFDTFVFDHLYASVLPLQQSGAVFDPISTITNGFKGQNANSSVWTLAAIMTGGDVVDSSRWQYKPASAYFRFEPSEQAWMSRWDRDNMARQFVSLYILTW